MLYPPKSRLIRRSTLIVAILLLLPTLVACAVDREQDGLTGTEMPELSRPATDAGTAMDETEPRIEDDLPDGLDYQGDEVVILSRNREGWTSGDIAVEKITGDALNDAVFERNTAVEERLHITIKSIADDEYDPTLIVKKVASTVKAGTHEYDILSCACYATLGETLNGTFADLRQSPYADWEKPWWSQGFNEVVEYQGAQYAVTGSMLLSFYRFVFVTVFNKDMFDDHRVSYLYEDVKAGTWTLDRQIELVPLFHIDAVNQGVQDEEGDIFGLVTNDCISVDPYWSACDVDILAKNALGEYELLFDASKLHAVADKVLKLYYDTGHAVYDYKAVGMDNEQNDIREMFAANGAAMATVRLLELESAVIRNMKSSYGVVPMPKFDEMQEDYATFLHDQFTVLSVPTSIEEERFDEIMVVLEAMGSASHYTIRPAYYEAMLRTKIAQDPESAEMLDDIISNIYIDAGIIYANALTSFQAAFRSIMSSGVNTVISDYRPIVAQTEQRKLPAILKQLDSLQSKP